MIDLRLFGYFSHFLCTTIVSTIVIFCEIGLFKYLMLGKISLQYNSIGLNHWQLKHSKDAIYIKRFTILEVIITHSSLVSPKNQDSDKKDQFLV